MRLMVLLILLSCSTQVPLKYKYTSDGRYVASFENKDSVVSRIEGELKNPVIFASGMDSTYLIVKLYDSKGNVLSEVDPEELSLSTSEDVEAKPFVMIQGAYKAEILPRVKSKKIRMRVDWLERVLSPEIVLETTVAPLKNELLPLNHEDFQSISVGEISVSRGGASHEHLTESFSLENLGDNKIVKKSTQRMFNFDYLEQARQNILLEVEESNDLLSDSMHSVFMFFPRKNLPLVEQLTGTIKVSLPTGEKMEFQKDSKEIVAGVFQEGALDPSLDEVRRHYADLKYLGKGVVLRANARGLSPQIGQSENSRIDLEYGTKGSVDVLILNGSTGQRCRRPKSDFWEPMSVTPIEFKYPSDEEFNAYLKKNCGFGLPKF